MQRSLTGERLTAVCALGWLLFNYPLLSLFDDGGTWLGIPSLYAYLFVSWAAFIGLLALAVETRLSRTPSSLRGSADQSVKS